jgi:hypothetical protein
MAGPPPEPAPTFQAVSDLMRTRTTDERGEEVGLFTDDGRTRPTASQVTRLIEQANTMVLARTGSLDPEVLECDTSESIISQANYVTALLAACLIELSYFPEQIGTDRSPYEGYKDLFESLIESLVTAARECRAGEVTPEPTDETALPSASWAFPVDRGGLVGWETRW